MNPRSSYEDQVTAKHTEHSGSLVLAWNTREGSRGAHSRVGSTHGLGTEFVN